MGKDIIVKKHSVILLLGILQGCVTPAICTKDGAFDAGRQQALAGKPADLDNGSVCEGESLALFHSNYQKGYNAGRDVLCSLQNAADDGRDAGLQGQSLAALPIRYNLCTEDKAKFEKTFMTAYRDALGQFCSSDSAGARGLAAGRANQGIMDIDATYLSCPSAQRQRLKRVYQEAFSRGLREYCQPSQHLETIRKLAMTHSQSTFDPQSYGNCSSQFPEVMSAYNETFYRERLAVVDRLCTYENGLNSGRSDADQLQAPQSGTPVFCDEQVSSRFLRGYDRGWTDQKQVICLREDYGEQGYQDGIRGAAFQPRIPHLCPDSYLLDVKNRYQAGYERGRRAYRPINNGPVPNQGGVAGEAAVLACGQVFTFDSDKLECIRLSSALGGKADDLVRACAQAFSSTSDRLQCIKNAKPNARFSSSAIRTCKAHFTFSSDVQTCIDKTKDTGFDPSAAIEACHAAFSVSSDQLQCLNVISTANSDPKARIQACKQSLHMSSDIMKCIAN